MSVIQSLSEQSQSDNLRCRHCNTVLPDHATFCSACGQRVDQDIDDALAPEENDVAERYRITSLIRRRPYVQLFFATDHERQQPVVVRNIDISSLDGRARGRAIRASQTEYAFLRRQRMPEIMPVADLRYFEGHLFLIQEWPFTMPGEPANADLQQYTLHGLLQSGIGLPDEEVALSWVYRLCQAVAHLHNQQITLGDLDPQAIVLSHNSYDGMPALVVSWLPVSIRKLLPDASDISYAAHFSAPEVLQGTIEPCSDIYSLGAILYMLLTGTAPDEPTQRQHRPLRPPHELNSHVSSEIEEVVMRALELEGERRFESVQEMAEALLTLYSSTKPVAPIKTPGRKKRTNQRKSKPATTSPATEEVQKEDAQAEPETSKSVVVASQVTEQEDTEATLLIKKHVSEQATVLLDEITQPTVSEDTLPETPAIARIVKKAQQEARVEQPAAEPAQPSQDQLETTVKVVPEQQSASKGSGRELIPVQRILQRLSGTFPSLPIPLNFKLEQSRALTIPPPLTDASRTLYQRVRRFLIGEQQHAITATAIIETPMRVQPDQLYLLRIRLMGRDAPVSFPHMKAEAPLAGLSALAKGDIVHVEVRSVLKRHYVYIVQQAEVTLPGLGYAVEIAIPMRTLSEDVYGRRERLQVEFTDKFRNPLYERPFALEIFISPLVHAGQEGHNVLTLPV
ncbi:hypothetical protein EPA93_25920 [Ktedonosporobacter rubrisoli]|uniref:non-specific serine/threonine protein kinase n=1 Tax=Ktedonosporobacter rubrisoli TaxID=2509675 RepID=A0A4P6JV48_KTERU|nr:protein kinase family protein [Ktedonosporobacter rubrisoli]QBD79233.1 hypothetical protein EPA93_25920 [Ktedonosporobacter rubrisoli]